mmetsp:Transcript_86719/g.269596  ORF Transcript_86719/g.269596 Transcript_86719/m.269596 type:complete len:226 (+) Transcript_86719:119-796(+)
MYLNSVLNDIQKESAPPKALNAEHLYKMNEAVFNLPEEDQIDKKMSGRLFQAVTRIRKAYSTGKVSDTDNNFFYDYVALLGTLQNQHFFSGDQTDQMLSWVKEAIDDGSSAPAPAAREPKGPTKAEEKKLKKLEEDNKRMKEELEQLRAVSSAVEVLKSFKLDTSAPEPKAKARARAKAKSKPKEEAAEAAEAAEEAPKEKKSKSKAKAKPKQKWTPKEKAEEAA